MNSVEQIFTEIHEFDPVDTNLILGQWHRDRATLRGFWVEAKVAAKTLVISKNENVKKLLIISRARSGTTLLTSLLNSHAFIYCEGEVLKRQVLRPAQYLSQLAAKSRNVVFGAKILSYQLVQVQRIRNPVRFFENLHETGFCFIHLKRNTFSQTLSLTLAQRSGRYHNRHSFSESRDAVRLDPHDFVRRIAWNDALMRYEDAIFKRIPHKSIQYERDLLVENRRQHTIDKISDWIGVPRCPVWSDLKKVLSVDPKESVENYDEVVAAVREGGFGHVLTCDQSFL